MEQIQQADGAEGKHPEGKEEHIVEGLLEPGHISPLYRGGEIAHAGHNGLKDLICDRLQGVDDGIVVAVKAGCGQSNELGDEDIIRGIDHHGPHLVHAHGGNISEDNLRILLAHGLDLFLPEIRVELVRLPSQEIILSPGGDHLEHQKQHIAFGQRQENNLHHIQQEIRPIVDSRFNILLLVADNQAPLIGVEIGHHRVGHKQQIDHIQMGNIRHLIHEDGVKR